MYLRPGKLHKLAVLPLTRMAHGSELPSLRLHTPYTCYDGDIMKVLVRRDEWLGILEAAFRAKRGRQPSVQQLDGWWRAVVRECNAQLAERAKVPEGQAAAAAPAGAPVPVMGAAAAASRHPGGRLEADADINNLSSISVASEHFVCLPGEATDTTALQSGRGEAVVAGGADGSTLHSSAAAVADDDSASS